MQISELVNFLENLRDIFGDIEVFAFHHEGGNSLRAYPEEVDEGSFLLKNGEELVIGGYYDPPVFFGDKYERLEVE